MPDVFLYPGEANPSDVKLRDPTSGQAAPQTVSPAGISSAEAVGSLTVHASIAVLPAGIASAEAIGSLTVKAAIAISPAGIASSEAVGAATVSAAITVSPAGISTGEALGTAALVYNQVVTAVSIASAEAIGAPGVAAQAATAPALTPGGARTSKGHGHWLKPGPWLFEYGPDAEIPELPPLVQEFVPAARESGRVEPEAGSASERREAAHHEPERAAEKEVQQTDINRAAQPIELSVQVVIEGRHRASKTAAKRATSEADIREAARRARRRRDDEEVLLMQVCTDSQD